MARRSGSYSSTKRKKELQRQKKQEEKRLRRQKNVRGSSQDIDGTNLMDSEQNSSENTVREKD